MPGPVLVLFSLRECPHCEAARQYLRERGVAFLERDVREEPGAVRDLTRTTGESVVPTIIYGDDVQIGWDAARVGEMLDDPLPPEEDDHLLEILEAATEPDPEWPDPPDDESFETVRMTSGTRVESAEVPVRRPRQGSERTSPAE